MKNTSTTFKITSANKRVNKTFDNFDDVKAHIKLNKLIPEFGSKTIEVEETSTTIHKVRSVVKPELTNSMKQALIDIVSNNKDSINHIYNVSNILYSYSQEWFTNNKNIDITLISDIVKTQLNVTEDEMIRFFKDPHRPIAGINLSGKILQENNKLFNTLFLENHLARKLDTIEFSYLQTDFKPCHAISINFDDFVIMIRSEDILLCQYKSAWGRNVNLIKELILTDELAIKHINSTDFNFI